ncbi:helix-turn-helix domain-containing protein [Streptacidiphilus sp. N1-3]|uniref:Helix-turn-helix domain-containing protein n=1 Tax=Streptacidiphilus alkalitolerans TaxID=3342712 RepID=A0ABV6XAW0_9ACTN
MGTSELPEGPSPEVQTDSLSVRIEYLFAEAQRLTGRRPTYEEVAGAINARAGEQTISSAYVWQLRNGKKDNPTRRHLQALADYFGVGPAYFFDEDPLLAVSSSLAARLNHLFDTVHPASGPYSNAFVSAELTSKPEVYQGGSLSPVALARLRNSPNARVSVQILSALAKFFGVRPEYFTDDAVAQATDRELQLAGALRDNKVRQVAMRSGPMTSDDVIGVLMETISKLQQNENT